MIVISNIINILIYLLYYYNINYSNIGVSVKIGTEFKFTGFESLFVNIAINNITPMLPTKTANVILRISFTLFFTLFLELFRAI